MCQSLLKHAGEAPLSYESALRTSYIRVRQPILPALMGRRTLMQDGCQERS